MKCALCEKEILPHPVSGWDSGNNADPLDEGRCCDTCNDMVVAARIRLVTGPKGHGNQAYHEGVVMEYRRQCRLEPRRSTLPHWR